MDCLYIILEKYQLSEDFLSRKLFGWGGRALETIYNSRGASQQELVQLVGEKIDQLANEILINPLDGSPLVDPVIERDWVWEKATHRDCQNLFQSISPFDGEKMEEEPQPHLFAQSMIAWVGNFIHKSYSSSETTVAPLNKSPSPAITSEKARLFVYSRLAKIAVANRQQEELQGKMETALVVQDTRLNEMKELDQQALERDLAAASEHEKLVAEKLDLMNQEYQSSVRKLNEQLDFMEEAHQMRVDSLERQMDRVEEENSKMASELRSQIEGMRESHQKARNVLEDQIKSLHEGHFQLKDRLTKEAQEHHAKISSITRSHAQVTTTLNNQILQKSQQVEQVQTSLHQASVENAQSAQEIQALRQAYANAQVTIRHLQNEIDDMDDGFCVIS